MGKFDLRDILTRPLDELDDASSTTDAGQPGDSAIDSASASAAPAAGSEHTESGATPPPDAANASPPPANTPPKKMFVRNNPSETPRPPDFTGSGLGTELGTSKAVDSAHPARLKPTDALSSIYEPGSGPGASSDLCELLLQRSLISNEQLSNAQRVQRQSPGRQIAEILIEMGADDAGVQQVVAEINRIPFERVNTNADDAVDQRSLSKLTTDFCKANMLLPLRRDGSRLVVGTTSPDDVFVLDDVKRRLGVASIKHVLITASDLLEAIDQQTETEVEGVDVDEILADVEEDDVEVVAESLEDADIADAEAAPVVRYVNHIIQSALKEGASDIHIEPEERKLKVRFRIDGVLFEMMNPPRKMHAALTSRLKIMANLDIAERRLPQDGRIRVTVHGRKLDLRMSTVPTPKGEKTVMRILDNRSIQVSLDELGFAEDTLTIWKNQIAQPHGIILVTGPTGSGKTTTLYSSIRQMDLQKLNVSTVEDPVEYNLSNITQIQTHEKIGMTFARALKALLRQDPDVVMVGEIRDMETAGIAIQAAMTGHLVLSTLHTNDAPSSITRLINIGIEPFLVGAAVNAVLAQRLVRRICSHCPVTEQPTQEMTEFLAMYGIDGATLVRGKGCNKCRETGYTGRVGLYELLVMDDFLRDATARNPNVTEYRRMCSERGMVSLREDGMRKVADGKTTVEEILRVTESTI